MGDDLGIVAVLCRDRINFTQLEINVKDYTKENYGSSIAFSDEYKNFNKLLKTLNSDILSRIKDYPKKEESLKIDAGTSSSGAHVVYHDPARTEQKELEPRGIPDLDIFMI